MTRSRIVRARGEGWVGVEPKAYKDGDSSFLDVARHTLLGGRDQSDALAFEVRYFEVAPGGYSSLERHAHPHAVVIIRGCGRVRLGDVVEEVVPLDVVYVAPHEVHRFEAAPSERLGFLCIVDRDRDRPERVSEPPAAER